MAKTNKREDGLYHKNMVVGKNSDGSYIRKSVYAKTKKELDRKITELTQELNSGIAIWENSISFAELADIWFNQYNPSATENWRYSHNGLLKKHLLPALGGLKIRDLRQIHLQTIITKLAKQDYATSTMKKIKQDAVRIMKVAVDSDLLTRNPFIGVIVPSKEAEERQPLTPQQINLVTENWRGHRMGHVAMIMLYAGLRRGEMLALTWEDIDLEHRRIRVNKSMSILCNRGTIKQPKTKSGTRDVPIPNILFNALSETQRPSGLVSPSTKGKQMSEVAYKRAWESYMRYLNKCAGGKQGDSNHDPIWVIDIFTAHMLRHTYATMLFDAGVDVKSAQKFLGHSDVEVILNIYTHLSKFKESSAIDALNSHLDG